MPELEIDEEAVVRDFYFRAICVADALEFLNHGHLVNNFNGCSIEMVTEESPDETDVMEETGEVDVNVRITGTKIGQLSAILEATMNLYDTDLITDTLKEATQWIKKN